MHELPRKVAGKQMLEAFVLRSSHCCWSVKIEISVLDPSGVNGKVAVVG